MIVEDTCSVSETGGNNGTFVNSPQLKEVESLSLEQWTSCYEQTLELVTDLYQKCRLVHADLSEYNLLLHNNEDVYVLVIYHVELRFLFFKSTVQINLISLFSICRTLARRWTRLTPSTWSTC